MLKYDYCSVLGYCRLIFNGYSTDIFDGAENNISTYEY
jgi:hypothetical protein